jgi:hypothetical protein
MKKRIGRRRARWIVLAFLPLACLLATLRIRERTHMLETVEVAGGRYEAPRSAFEKLIRFIWSQPVPYDGYDLFLEAPRQHIVWIHFRQTVEERWPG